jgi:Rrf2 family protein
VDLALTRRGDYAVRAALCLARRGGEGGYVKMREVAATMALPASYTPQVLRLLAEAGLAEARAGRDGGYRLTRPPDEIALLEVVEAAEGVFRLERCILRGGPCHWEQACAVHAALVGGSPGLPGLAGPDHPGRPGGADAGTSRPSRPSRSATRALAASAPRSARTATTSQAMPAPSIQAEAVRGGRRRAVRTNGTRATASPAA